MSTLSLENINGVLDQSILASLFPGYKNLQDKAFRLTATGDLVPLKKGFYLSGKSLASGKISKAQIANALYGPSYVSFYSALSHHGLIPERVMSTESATIKRSISYETKIGTFDYLKMPLASFHLGIEYSIIGDSACLMANPSKALIDLLWRENTRTIYGVEAMMQYLIEDLRMDEEALGNLDLDIVGACKSIGKNKRILGYLELVIKKLGTWK